MPQNGALGDVATAMVTPFSPDGELDSQEALRLARWLVANGSDSLVLVGTTGESPTLTDNEKRQLVSSVAEELPGVPLVVGASTYDTAHSVRLASWASQDGATALLAVTPYYSKPSQSGLVAHFRAIADATDLPVYLYNIPGRSSLLIELETVIDLAEHPKIVGIKDATADLAMTSRVAANTPDDFEIYSGDDALTLPMLAIGAAGVISVAAHLCGNAIAEMIHDFKSGDVDSARSRHLALLDLFRLLFVEPSPGPVKAGCELLGFSVGHPRLPMQQASELNRAAVERELKRLEILGGSR